MYDSINIINGENTLWCDDQIMSSISITVLFKTLELFFCIIFCT